MDGFATQGWFRGVRRHADPHTAPPPEQPVHRALAGLAPGERELIALVYWSELAPEQIAQRLGIAPAELPGATRRALARLAAAVEQASVPAQPR